MPRGIDPDRMDRPTGYRVANVLVDGVSVRAVSTYLFSNVTMNHTIAASFGAIVVQPSVTVMSPNRGEIWRRGTTQFIKWAYTGAPGASVKIELLKGGVWSSTVVSSVPVGTNGAGSYSWKIPTKQATGSNYSIRVTSTSNASYTDVSNASFTIK